MTKPILQTAAPRHGFRLDNENADLGTYLRQVNGRANTYVFNAVDIESLGHDLEKQFDDACIPSCRRLGITAVVRSAGPHKSGILGSGLPVVRVQKRIFADILRAGG